MTTHTVGDCLASGSRHLACSSKPISPSMLSNLQRMSQRCFLIIRPIILSSFPVCNTTSLVLSSTPSKCIESPSPTSWYCHHWVLHCYMEVASAVRKESGAKALSNTTVKVQVNTSSKPPASRFEDQSMFGSVNKQANFAIYAFSSADETLQGQNIPSLYPSSSVFCSNN